MSNDTNINEQPLNKTTQNTHTDQMQINAHASTNTPKGNESDVTNTSSEEQSINTKLKATQSEIPERAKLMVFLLDSSVHFSTPQEQLLELAKSLVECGFEPHIFCLNDSTLMQKAKDNALNTHAISSGNSPSFLGFMRAFWQQKRNAPLCIHSFAENCLSLAYKIAKIRKENSTLILHSCFESPPSNKALQKFWSAPKKIVYPSKYIANQWARIGIDPAQINVIYTASQGLKPYVERKIKRWIFIAFEDLEQGSGLDLLLKAMSALWQHPYLPEWELRIVGHGPLFENLLNEAHSLGVASRLSLLSEQNISDVLEHAHVLISPHLDAQGNLDALIYAWSVGMPLICTMTNAHMEVANTSNALLVPEADAQRLAAAMIELMCRPERMEYITKASNSMRTFAHMPRLQEQYMNLYSECIARHGWVVQTKKKTNSNSL